MNYWLLLFYAECIGVPVLLYMWGRVEWKAWRHGR